MNRLEFYYGTVCQPGKCGHIENGCEWNMPSVKSGYERVEKSGKWGLLWAYHLYNKYINNTAFQFTKQ